MQHDASFEGSRDLKDGSQESGQPGYEQEWERQMKDSESLAIDLEKYGEDELIVEALRIGGGDLYHYTQKVEADLRRAETEAIEDYVRQSTGVAELRLHIEECDKVLSVFDKILQDFQDDLGKVGNQIKDMNERARSFDVLAANRKAAESHLTKFIDGVAIPKGLLKAIHEDPLTPEFSLNLEKLQHKLNYLNSEEANTQAAVVQHVKPVLERLKAKAAERVKEHAVARVKGLGADPSAFLPSYISQVGETEARVKEAAAELLSPLAPQVAFLAAHDPSAMAELQAKYQELVGGALVFSAKALMRETLRYQTEVFRSTDTLIDKESGRGGMRGLFSKGIATASQLRSKVEAKSDAEAEREDPFELRERLKILSDLPSITKTVEASFKVLMTYLIGAIRGQNTMAGSIFPEFSSDFSHIVLQPTLQAIEESFSHQIRRSQDPIALLLIARTIEETREEVMRLKSMGLEAEDGGLSIEPFFQRMSMAVWPVFKSAVELQVDSLKKAEVSSFLAFSGAESKVQLATKRFASLSAALHAVNSGLSAQPYIMGSRSLDYLRIEFERFSKRVAEGLGGSKKQLIFSVNQYYHILSAYYDHGVPAAACAPIRKILDSSTTNYMDGLVKDNFSALETFGAKVEEAEAKESFALVDEKEAKKVLEEFSKSWKKALTAIHSALNTTMADPENAQRINKKAATRVFLYYCKLRDIIKAQYPTLAGGLIAEEDVIEQISGAEGAEGMGAGGPGADSEVLEVEAQGDEEAEG